MKNTGKRSRRRTSRRRVNRNKTSMLAISIVLLLLVAVVAVKGTTLHAKEKNYLAQETELKKQIEEEQSRSEEIDELESYVGTDEYVEEVAKAKLGLINENEIILKAK